MTGPALEIFRLATAVAGFLAAMLLAWRLIGWWTRMDVLHHALGLCLGAGIVFGTVYIVQIGMVSAPYVWSGWLIFGQRVAVIFLCLFWPRWIGRAHSPFRRRPATA